MQIEFGLRQQQNRRLSLLWHIYGVYFSRRHVSALAEVSPAQCVRFFAYHKPVYYNVRCRRNNDMHLYACALQK
jgi:hypothetical protein